MLTLRCIKKTNLENQITVKINSIDGIIQSNKVPVKMLSMPVRE